MYSLSVNYQIITCLMYSFIFILIINYDCHFMNFFFPFKIAFLDPPELNFVALWLKRLRTSDLVKWVITMNTLWFCVVESRTFSAPINEVVFKMSYYNEIWKIITFVLYLSIYYYRMYLLRLRNLFISVGIIQKLLIFNNSLINDTFPYQINF